MQVYNSINNIVNAGLFNESNNNTIISSTWKRPWVCGNVTFKVAFVVDLIARIGNAYDKWLAWTRYQSRTKYSKSQNFDIEWFNSDEEKDEYWVRFSAMWCHSNELAAYKSSLLKTNLKPLQFWKANHNSFLILSKQALKSLPVEKLS